MSISDEVVETVREMGKATTAQVHAKLGGRYSSKQINKALSYAVSGQRRLVTTRKAIPGSAVIEATYRVVPDDAVYLFTPNRSDPIGPRYASVWEYAKSFEPKEELFIPTLATAWNDTTRRAA